MICGRYAYPEWACAHYIARSQGGLGIEQNIVTLCPECHREYDNGLKRAEYGKIIKEYLTGLYGPFRDSELKYRKDMSW